MSNILPLPTANKIYNPFTKIYEHLGLSDNPFPIEAIINPASHDPRVDGSIFASEIRRDVITPFESKLLGVLNPEQRYRLGYLWTQEDPPPGRGVGKTATLLYLQRRINQGWGRNYFKDQFPVCALYVRPIQRMNKLEHIALLALREMATQRVLDAVLSRLRYKVIAAEWIPKQQLRTLNLHPADERRLLDNDWLVTQGVDIEIMSHQTLVMLILEGIEYELAEAIVNGNFLIYLRSMRQDNQLDFPAPPHDIRLYRKANYLFFTQAVKLLRLAGFGAVYLFIDDIEDIVGEMSRSERSSFIKELGDTLFRGDHEASVSRFITLVFTTYNASANRLADAWGRAGLQPSLPLMQSAPNAILMPIIGVAEAVEIFKSYLQKYQLQQADEDFHPFTQESVEKLVQLSNYHPREFLAKGHYVVERAKEDENIQVIDTDYITKCFVGQQLEYNARQDGFLE